jgi:hypothetical protein
MKTSPVFLLLILMTVAANAQEYCNKRKPAHFQKPYGAFNDKLLSDRFNHTITSQIVKYRYTQIEVVTIFRNEILENSRWVNDPTDFTYNIYNGLSVRHSFGDKFELQVSYTDFIAKGDIQVKEFSKSSLNTGISFGVKYCLYSTESKSSGLSLFGQITIPKPRYTFNTFLTPEIRLLFSHPFGRHITFTYNLGTAYSPVTEKIILLYAINPKLLIGKRLEVFTEFFKSFVKTGPARTPIKRGSFGLGFYFMENLYFYSSMEAGWYHEESLNTERFDIGITYRFL